MSVVGARPQFVKLAPVDRALGVTGYEHVIVHTGQHYASLLSDTFFDDLGISAPKFNLSVGSGGHAEQTANILTRLDPVIREVMPDWVLVYGDTNSTLGGALAAAQQGRPLAHLEAGLRSFDRRMPEERNRIVAGHLADLLLAPSPAGAANLAREGLSARTVVVGDVMVDVLIMARDRVAREPERYLPEFARESPYLLATVHRAETTDDPRRLATTLTALAACPLPVWLVAHPRLVNRARQLGLRLSAGSMRSSEPLPYFSMIAAMTGSRGIVTDSGGLQKEALLLGVPCTTLRDRTEWPETLAGGWNVLVPQPEQLAAAALRPHPQGVPPRPYGDGRAASRVVAELARRSAAESAAR
jgi:UDP-N-acetylglucosamine 2-epimerase (non-hydrolysing)